MMELGNDHIGNAQNDEMGCLAVFEGFYGRRTFHTGHEGDLTNPMFTELCSIHSYNDPTRIDIAIYTSLKI